MGGLAAHGREVWCRQLLGGRDGREVWEGSEVATRGKAAADFKPALNSTLTGFALEIKERLEFRCGA